ncbi:hypothetical protein JKP88DRAFT_266799 [Tribonema minus]|uniref:39S ribosomal protein L22, mitochondrial n=1 Tax=Tribonema minus TaxID=303371 RepID=A0A835ZCV4_9STRA|nr:hypothetical protein JKP88DRAFT_266799 [Tribonema minus]
MLRSVWSAGLRSRLPCCQNAAAAALLRPMSSTSINDTTVTEDTAADFSYVGRKQGKTHYYDAFNQHLKDEGLFMAKDDRDFMRGKGRWKTLAAEQYDAAQIVRRQELAIRVSPLKLNLVAKLVRGLTVRQAVAQLTFSKKKHAKVHQRVRQVVAQLTFSKKKHAKVYRRSLTVRQAVAQLTFSRKKHAKTTLQLLSDACREAREKFGFIPDQLELDQIYVGKGEQQKRQRIMGKGRTGLGYRRWAHLTVHLREIDFDGKISSSRAFKRNRLRPPLTCQRCDRSYEQCDCTRLSHTICDRFPETALNLTLTLIPHCAQDVRAARHWMKLKLQTQALVERENDREQRSAGGTAR